jgi:hypothetical protein
MSDGQHTGTRYSDAAPGGEIKHGPGKDDSTHAQNRTCYRIPIPHERNCNRILKVSKETEKPSFCL